MKKRVIAAVLALSAVLAGCGTASDPGSVETKGNETGAVETGGDNPVAEKTDIDQYLKLAWLDDIETADAHKSSASYVVPMNIFDRLVEVEVDENNQAELVPSLAKDWDISEDGLVYTLYLRDDVKYWNGNDFTAEDVAYSLKRMLTVDGACNTEFVDQIAGADALYNGETDELEGVKVIDDYTIEITLGEPFAGFLACLSTPAVSIYDSEATEEAGDRFGIDPAVTVGTGPFKLVSWTPNSELVFEKNDTYWGGDFSLEGIDVKIIPDSETQSMMYQRGEIDIFDLENSIDDIDFYVDNYADKLVGTTRVAINYISINENIEPFRDVRVRQALQMAIDRQTILDALYGGRGQLENGIFPVKLIGHNDALPEIEYNPERAKELLAEAGYPDGFSMEFAADSDASPTTNMVLQVVAEQLKEVGIDAEIKMYDESTWFDTRSAGELPSYISSWSADYNDPDNFIYAFFGTADKSAARSFNYDNEEIIGRVQSARAISDVEKRVAEYQDLEKIIIQDEAAWIPLYSRDRYFVISDRVAAFEPLWNGWSEIYYKTVELK